MDLKDAVLEGRILARSDNTIKLSYGGRSKEVSAGEFYSQVPTELKRLEGWNGDRPVEGGQVAQSLQPPPHPSTVSAQSVSLTNQPSSKVLPNPLPDSSAASSSSCPEETPPEGEVSEHSIQYDDADLTLPAIDIPYRQHGTPDSLKAKYKEIKDLFDFEAIKVVKRKDLPANPVILNFVWLIQDKPRQDGTLKRKARLCVNGRHEPNKEQLETRSPTARKTNVRLAYAMAATHPDYIMACSDITRSFLQGRKLDRQIFVNPVPEFGLGKDELISLEKAVYGLGDGTYRFFVEHHLKLTGHGMEICANDPATTFHHKDNSEPGDEVRDWSGMNCQHVDDNCQVLSKQMYNEVRAPMQDDFAYGMQQELKPGGELEFLGMRITRCEQGIAVDQDKYVEALQPITIPEGLLLLEALPDQGQTEFRSLVAKLQQLAVSCKPGIMVQCKELAMRNGEATKKDVRALNKLLASVKARSTRMIFPNLGPSDQWCIVAYSDASFRSDEDSIASKGGRVILLCNRITHAAAVLGWRSGGLSRVVRSAKAAEALSLGELVDDIDKLKQTLSQMFGSKLYNLDTLICIDCADLSQSLDSLKEIKDGGMVLDTAIIKQKVDTLGLADEVRLVRSDQMIADGLTKKSAPSQSLEQILATGQHTPPGGYNINRRKEIPKKLWVSLSALPKGKSLRNSKWASTEQPTVSNDF